MTKEELINNAATTLIKEFENGSMPKAVALTIIDRLDDDVRPCDKWSLGNRILMYFQHTADARGYKQWKKAGRSVRHGSHAIHILAPMVAKRKETDKISGEEKIKQFIKGFTTIPVFRVEDTEGEPLAYDKLFNKPERHPRFFDVAEKLGISVAYRPMERSAFGSFSVKNNSITLNSCDAVVFYHELSHAIHNTLVDLKTYDSAKAEVIAEFSAIVMANIAGIEGYEQQGFNYIKHYAAKHSTQGTLKEIMSILNDVEAIVNRALSVSDDYIDEAVDADAEHETLTLAS
ncbi:MAG: ArdC family protein [Schwartzia succinivorans]|nr:ArdC family protein [Schwartzia succinivorans]